jgi:hypothetical protein
MKIVGKVEREINFFSKVQSCDENDSIYTIIKKGTPCIVYDSFYDSRSGGLYYDIEIENGIFLYRMRTNYYNIYIGKWVDLIYYGKYIEENDVKPGTIVFAQMKEGAYLSYGLLKRNDNNVNKWKTLNNVELDNSWSVYTYIIVEEKKEI